MRALGLRSASVLSTTLLLIAGAVTGTGLAGCEVTSTYDTASLDASFPDYEAGTYDGAAPDAGTPDASPPVEAGGDVDAGPLVPAYLGMLVHDAPTTVVKDDGTGATPLSSPTGVSVAVSFSRSTGRLILLQGPAERASLVSVRPDGTGRTVLVDATTLPLDSSEPQVVAVAPDGTVYYTLTRAAGDGAALYLGSVQSDGTKPAAPIQLTGGTTGNIAITFFGKIDPYRNPLYARLREQIFTTDGRLVYGETDASGNQVRVRAITPDLATKTTVFEHTPGLFETVCGVTPAGKVIFTRHRAAETEVIDAYSVNLDGTGATALNPVSVTTLAGCEVGVGGRVFLRTYSTANFADVFLASGGALVPIAATADDEAFVGETPDGRVVYSASDPDTNRLSLHVVDAAGANRKTLVAKTDAAGGFGSFVALTRGDRLVFTRTTNPEGGESLHSVKLDGTGRLDVLPTGMFRPFEAHGVTGNERLVYRAEDATGNIRLWSARVDAVTSPGVPQQVMLANDSAPGLVLLLD